MSLQQHIDSVRDQFPALQRHQSGEPVVFFDGPAGTQVPLSVITAISDYLANRNANHGGLFLTSQESDQMLTETHQAAADLLGASDPDCIAFGPNMTTLTFAMSRALARTWRAGDEVIVTRLDHDANVTPWLLAAEDTGAVVHFVELHREDCTLDLQDLRNKLNDRTRMVAVGCASNSVGTINPVRRICEMARAAGAMSFLDAVHYAPHALIDVESFGCDFLACSAYKFYGPHIGLIWGRRELLEETVAYKLRPATNELPGKWMTGTQNHECVAGTLAAIDYLAGLGRTLADNLSLARRDALQQVYDAIGDYEQSLARQLLQGLAECPGIKVWGITDPNRLDERMPTVSITHARLTAIEVATHLAKRGIFAWHGNYYALQLTESLRLEPEGMVRLGLVHYNTKQEVDRCLQALAEIE